MNLTGLIIGLFVGVAWLVGCCLLIHKIGIKKHRITLYVVAAVIFVVCGATFCGTWIGAAVARKVININAELVDEYIIDRYGDVKLVRDGVDVADVPQAINDLEAITPRVISDFGVSDVFLGSLYRRAIRVVFDRLRAKTDFIVNSANEDGKVTSTTLINAVEHDLIYRIGRFVFWNILINAVILAIFLGICIILLLRKDRETVVFGKTE